MTSGTGAPALAPRPERVLALGAAAVAVVLAAAAAVVLAEPEAGLLLLALALGGLVVTAWPHWGILAIFLMVILRLRLVQLGPLGAAEALGAALVLPLLLRLARDRTIWIWHVPLFRLVLAIGAVLLAATAWSFTMLPPPPAQTVDPTWSPWGEQISYARFLVLLIFFVHFIRTPRQLGHAVLVVIAIILLLAGDALGLIGEGPPGMRAQAATFGGFAGNENRLAFLCVWGISLFWALRVKGPRGWWRPLTLVPLLVLPVTALLTGSRSGLLQLLLLAALILLEQRHWSPAQRVQAVVLIAVVAMVAALAVPDALLHRVTNFDAGGPTTIARYATYHSAAALLADNPFFGVGPGNFVWRNQELSGYFLGTHNSYLWALTSGGPLLLLAFLALFHRTYRTLRAVERHGAGRFTWLATALRFNLITYLMFSFFANVWQAEVFWILVGLTIALSRLAPAAAPRRARPRVRAFAAA